MLVGFELSKGLSIDLTRGSPVPCVLWRAAPL